MIHRYRGFVICVSDCSGNPVKVANYIEAEGARQPQRDADGKGRRENIATCGVAAESATASANYQEAEGARQKAEANGLALAGTPK